MWKVFQPQLYNYHVSGNKILTSIIFATKSLKQQNSKWITSYCYCTINCTVLDCWLLSFFLISSPCNSKFLQIELYRDIIIVLIHFGVHGLWFKSKIIYKRSGTFLPWNACLGFQLPIPDCAMSKGWGGSYAQSPCTKLSEGPWRHPRGRGHVGTRGTRGDTWPLGPVTTSEQSPGLHPRLWTLSLGTAVCCGAERSTAPKSVL